MNKIFYRNFDCSIKDIYLQSEYLRLFFKITDAVKQLYIANIFNLEKHYISFIEEKRNSK